MSDDGDPSPSPAQSARWWRSMDRAFAASKRAQGGEGGETVCPICYVAIEAGGPLIAVTTCGHAYHGACWSNFTQSRAPPIEVVGERVVSPAHLLAATYLNAFAGPPCPLCRTKFPMIHHMAMRLADKECAKVDRENVKVDVDTSLLIASRAW